MFSEKENYASYFPKCPGKVLNTEHWLSKYSLNWKTWVALGSSFSSGVEIVGATSIWFSHTEDSPSNPMELGKALGSVLSRHAGLQARHKLCPPWCRDSGGCCRNDGAIRSHQPGLPSHTGADCSGLWPQPLQTLSRNKLCYGRSLRFGTICSCRMTWPFLTCLFSPQEWH